MFHDAAVPGKAFEFVFATDILRTWLPTWLKFFGLEPEGTREPRLSSVPLCAPQIVASEVQERVDCTACANCCRHSVVSANKSEIENIARHMGTTSEAVARLYTVPDPDAPASRILRNSV
jgi:hypothetical protein